MFLKGLPTVMETATTLFNQVFHTYGLLEDIVSDRGPQFMSRVWSVFCTHLDINVSLSSSFSATCKGTLLGSWTFKQHAHYVWT